MRDLHTHTVFSDGRNTPEEMVLAALEKGMTAIGISDHGYAPCDLDCCMPKEKIGEYQQTIRALQEKYAGRIEILRGIEQDYYGTEPVDAYDYVIGSVHYVRAGEVYVPVDLDKKTLLEGAQYFGGDIYGLIEAYYANVGDVVRKTGADIIGHFDLITKFNEPEPLFDTAHPRYIAAWKGAVDALIPYGKPFEINTGAMSRGYRTGPYPAADIREYIRQKGGSFLLSSDSHSAETLCYGFKAFPLMGEGVSPKG